MIAKLESALGRKLYHFADPEIDYDDDNCHRFLALHCWCSLVPDSNFVTYLLEVTGIQNVETLKAALVSPASYRHAFDMNDAFVGIEPWPACRFEYLGDKRRRVGVVFQSREARLRAEEVALQQIGADVLFLYSSQGTGDPRLAPASPPARVTSFRAFSSSPTKVRGFRLIDLHHRARQALRISPSRQHPKGRTGKDVPGHYMASH